MITNISNGKSKAYIDAQDKVLADAIAAETANRNSADTVLQGNIDGKAPIDHASTGTSYGAATDTKYGHVKVDTAVNSSSVNPVQNKAVYTELAKKQNNLTFDSAPTAGSANPVTSGGIKTALDNAINGLGTAARKDAGTNPGNVLLLDSSGKIPMSVYDSFPISEFVGTVSSKSALTTLSAAQKGDYAVVTGSGDSSVDGTYILAGSTYSEASAWVQISTPNTAWGNISGSIDDQADLRQALDAKQDNMSSGTGIVISENKVSLGTSGVTAGSKGSATQIPVLTVDAYGRVTALSGTTVYPPTSAGTANQYWRSDGSGAGVWTTPLDVPTSGSKVMFTAGGAYTYLAKKQDNLVKLQLTLAVASWDTTAKTISVTATGVTESGFLIVGPDSSSQDEWEDCGIRATAQAAGSLTFACDEVPADAVKVNVLMVP